MANEELESLMESYFEPKQETVGAQKLQELIKEIYEASMVVATLSERKGRSGRFSYKIDIPTLVPSEAWGDPSHQSREDIERVFNVIRKKANMQERIQHVNSFIDPAQAAKKAPGGNFHAVIRMMQIIEALQAAGR